MIKAELISNRLSEQQIMDIVDDFISNQKPVYLDEEEYLKGQNSKILASGVDASGGGTGSVDPTVPNWRIPVAYGRKIIKTVTGYMYLPGLINYEIPNGKDAERISTIFKDNNEPVLDQSLGMYQGTNGRTYELHYLEDDDILKHKMAMLKATQGIAIYDYSIIPKMVAFIRAYTKAGVEVYVVYYNDMVMEYQRVKEGKSKTKLVKVDEYANVFKQVPVVEIENNANKISDISVVKELIDSYDNILSGGMNEFSRFAFAYLRLVGMSIDPKDVAKTKELQIFENLDNKDAVTFLTKDIPTDFLEKTADRIKAEIHRQAFIPDIDSLKFGGATSGVALEKFIYIMEYIAADKEAYFRLGIQKRLELIDAIQPLNDLDGIKVIFNRNRPASDLQNAQIYSTLDGRGVRRETLMRKYLSWIEDPAAELEAGEEEEPDDPGLDQDIDNMEDEDDDTGNED